MNVISRKSRVLFRNLADNFQKTQRANYLHSGHIRRFIPMDKPLDYEPLVSGTRAYGCQGCVPRPIIYGSIVTFIAYIVFKAEGEPHQKRQHFANNWEQPNTVKKFVILEYKDPGYKWTPPLNLNLTHFF